MDQITPPALVHHVESFSGLIAHVAGQMKAMKRDDKMNLERALDMGRALSKLHGMCTQIGEWTKALEQAGIARQQASIFIWGASQPASVRASWESINDIRRAMPENTGQTGEDTSAGGRTGQAESTNGGGPWPEDKRCRDCRTRGKNDPKCKACQELNKPDPSDDAEEEEVDAPPDREPGDDTETEAAAEAEYAAVPKDEAGHCIPEPLLPAFAALTRFKEIESHVRSAQKLIDETAKAPGGEQLARCTRPVGPEGKTIHKTEELEALKRHLHGTRPYSICPRCLGKGTKSCGGCSGTGWVTKVTWTNMEEAVKARLA